MNKYPKNIEIGKPLDLKLGIKSSLPQVKAPLGLIYFLWKSNNKPSDLYYSKELLDPEGNTYLVLENEVEENLIKFLEKEHLVNDNTKQIFKDEIKNNPILNSQIEALKVTFELVWKLAKFSFVDDSLPFSAERSKVKGKTVRYNKSMMFTSVIDLIDIVVEENKKLHLSTLFSWVLNENDHSYTEKSSLEKLFTVLSDESIFRIRVNQNEEIKFNMGGIYEVLDSQTDVIIKDYKESMGSLRILGSILKEELNFFLTRKSRTSSVVSLDLEKVSERQIKSYAKRVNTHFELLNIDLSSINDVEKVQEKDNNVKEEIENVDTIKKPYQRIFFGAPGTGKSYQLNKEAEQYFGKNYARVTFHPNYMYGNFVGAFKPYPKKVVKDGFVEEMITYEYVEGVFMRQLVKALVAPNQNYLLLIEEINRANVAGVFGDIFQLLDRDENGESQYHIETSKDQRLFLEKANEKLGGNRLKERLGSNFEKLYLPDNFYIWATMNSSDQGIMPMDTAFRRRWDFTYVGINDAVKENEALFSNYRIKVSPNETALWNDFRLAVNKKLAAMNIPEDKFLGPFFISKNILDNSTVEELTDVVKSKVIMYLYEDVAKGRRNELFEDNKCSTYSETCFHFEMDAKNLFREGLDLDTEIIENKNDKDLYAD